MVRSQSLFATSCLVFTLSFGCTAKEEAAAPPAPPATSAAPAAASADGPAKEAPSGDGKTTLDVNHGGMDLQTQDGTKVEVKNGPFGIGSGISVQNDKVDLHLGNKKKEEPAAEGDAEKKKRFGK